MAKYFSYETDPMLACPCCGTKGLSEAFLLKLDELREACGFPLRVNSGYRCPDYNDKMSATGRSGPHTQEAVDLSVSHEHAFELLYWAVLQGWTGIGIQQKGDSARRFIHLDRLNPPTPRPRVWSY